MNIVYWIFVGAFCLGHSYDHAEAVKQAKQHAIYASQSEGRVVTWQVRTGGAECDRGGGIRVAGGTSSRAAREKGRK